MELFKDYTNWGVLQEFSDCVNRGYSYGYVDVPIPLAEVVGARFEKAVRDLERLEKYIHALENEPVRSKTIIRKLRIQTGMDEYTDGFETFLGSIGGN